MIPMEVVVTDERGTETYNYQVEAEDNFTPMLLMSGAAESVYAHNEPPEEHTIRYSVEVDFEGLGTFKSANFTSQRGMGGVAADLMMPTMAMMSSPFGKARVTRARAEVIIERGARAASFDEVILPRTVFKPGEKVEVRVRWMHYRQNPAYTNASYELELPTDLPDGEYELRVCSPLAPDGLADGKPHLFKADSLEEMLKAFNRLSGCPTTVCICCPCRGRRGRRSDRVARTALTDGRFADSRRTDAKIPEALAVRHDTPCGLALRSITVSRRADQ